MPVLSYNDIEDSYKVNDKNGDELNSEESSRADIPATREDIAKHTAFHCSMPLESIFESIEKQFDDYINIDDRINYVDLFYDSLARSYEYSNADDEMLTEEIVNTLDDIKYKFINKLSDLLNTRLTLSIASIEAEDYNDDQIEFIIRKLYRFFILDAKSNFKSAIYKDMKQQIPAITDNREYIKRIRNLISNYSPLITTFGPMEFLKYRGDEEIIQLFEDGKVIGNFLRKYSPKLYQNEEFEVELINYITMVHQIKQEVFNNG